MNINPLIMNFSKKWFWYSFEPELLYDKQTIRIRKIILPSEKGHFKRIINEKFLQNKNGKYNNNNKNNNYAERDNISTIIAFNNSKKYCESYGILFRQTIIYDLPLVILNDYYITDRTKIHDLRDQVARLTNGKANHDLTKILANLIIKSEKYSVDEYIKELTEQHNIDRYFNIEIVRH